MPERDINAASAQRDYGWSSLLRIKSLYCSSISPTPVKPEGSIGLHSVRRSLSPSVRHTRFPDFSLLCFHLFGWKLVASFCMKSYRSSSSFVTVDLLLHELLPFVIENSFSGLFLAMLSYIWMKVGSRVPFKELQIKFYFCHGWPTFSWVIVLCYEKFVFRTFLGYAFIYLSKVGGKLSYGSYRSSSTFVTVDLLFRELLPFVQRAILSVLY